VVGVYLSGFLVDIQNATPLEIYFLVAMVGFIVYVPNFSCSNLLDLVKFFKL
jgi:hypothetical protein